MVMVLQASSAAQACQFTDWLFGRNQDANAAQEIVPPVITYYTPAYYPVTTVGYTQPTVKYIPQTTYRTVYRRMPVTVYRPNVTVMSPSGLPVTNYQGCTTSRYRVQRVPSITCQPVYSCPPNPCAQPSVMGSQAYAGANPYYTPAAGVPANRPPGTWGPPNQSLAPINTIPASPTAPTISSPGSTEMRSLPGGSPGASSQFTNPATGNRPAGRSPADIDPSLIPNSRFPTEPSTQMKPVAPIEDESAIKVQVVRPPYSTSSAPSSKPVENMKLRSTIIPIPDPERYPDVIGEDEAPELFNPNDKTAFLTTPKPLPVGWQSFKTSSIRPASYRREVAKPRFDDSGWKSSAR